MKEVEGDHTLVVVEDDAIEILAIRRGLRRLGLGWSLRPFPDGVEALAGLRDEYGSGPVRRPYSILLDLNLPRMNGIEFLDELRADPALQDASVVVLTTSDDLRDLSATTERRVDAYFNKARAGEDYVDALKAVERLYRTPEA